MILLLLMVDMNIVLRLSMMVQCRMGKIYGGWQTMPEDLSNVISIASGWYHNLALKSDGTVVTWGWNGYNFKIFLKV